MHSYHGRRRSGKCRFCRGFPERGGLRQDARMAGSTRSRSAASRGTRGATDDAESPPRAAATTRSRIGLLAPLGAAALAHIVYLHVMYDDAFITYRYAENLARGLGLVYNPGERVEGYSNFLWTLMMAVVVKLGGRPEDWGPALSA